MTEALNKRIEGLKRYLSLQVEYKKKKKQAEADLLLEGARRLYDIDTHAGSPEDLLNISTEIIRSVAASFSLTNDEVNYEALLESLAETPAEQIYRSALKAVVDGADLSFSSHTIFQSAIAQGNLALLEDAFVALNDKAKETAFIQKDDYRFFAWAVLSNDVNMLKYCIVRMKDIFQQSTYLHRGEHFDREFYTSGASPFIIALKSGQKPHHALHNCIAHNRTATLKFLLKIYPTNLLKQALRLDDYQTLIEAAEEDRYHAVNLVLEACKEKGIELPSKVTDLPCMRSWGLFADAQGRSIAAWFARR